MPCGCSGGTGNQAQLTIVALANPVAQETRIATPVGASKKTAFRPPGEGTPVYRGLPPISAHEDFQGQSGQALMTTKSREGAGL